MSAYTFAPISTAEMTQYQDVRTPLHHAPGVLKDQTAEQRQKCLNEIVTDVREQNISTLEGIQSIFAKRMATRRAFIKAFEPTGVFTQAFAVTYRLAHQDAMSPAIALQEAQSYVLNRRDEQLSMLKQMEDPKFLQDVMQALATGYQPQSEAKGISDQKRKVLIDELVQLKGMAGKEPAIHIHDTARGHVAGHVALAKALDPQGPLASVLTGVLMPLAPHLQPEEVSRTAYKYLAHFQRLAVEVADALHENGDIVQEAVRQSEEARQAGGVVLKLAQDKSLPDAEPRKIPTTTVSWMQLLGSFLPPYGNHSRA